MSRKAKAVVCRELNKPVMVEEVTVEPPRRGEVTVKLGACGVCHSDLSATNGTIPMPPPLILGHEAAGEVVELGEGVDGFALGDHVVASFIYMCGKCRFCSAGRPVLCLEQGKAISTLPDGTLRTRDARGDPLNVFSGCGVMAEYATVHGDNLVRIDPKIPLDRAALVGCAVTTGVGAVINTAKVTPGSTVAVLGCGGVGLNVIQGARIAGAARIIAVDAMEAKLLLAKKFGATGTLLAKPDEDLAKALKKLTGGGPDYAFECVGNGELAAAAYRAICRGGVAVVVGVAKPGDSTAVRTMTLPFEEKTLTGSYFGSCVPRIVFPRMLGLYMCGQLKLDELITSLDPQAERINGLEAGADDFLSKPVNWEELFARVKSLLRVKRLQDEVVSWNMELEGRVRDQVSQLERLSRLKRFFSRQVAEAIIAGGEEILKPHRRDITAVFLDLRGFTAFTDRADPDEVLELLRAYHATLGATVEESGGTLEHFAGDGMMIIFNDPFPVDRPAERAVRMAMALQRAFGPISGAWAKLGHNVGLGIGIAQGEATLGVIGFEQRWEYAAIGNVPNLAARLCGEAGAGEIILDAQTERAVADIAETDPVGPLTLRGFQQPIAAFKLKALS